MGVTGPPAGDLYNQGPRLIDGADLDGIWSTTSCAAICGQATNWWSMELDAPGKVTKLKIARRMNEGLDQGQNVKVTIGSTPEYNPNDPVCVEIADLTRTAGLQDYECDQGQHIGKYVKISNDKGCLTICEAQVFVTPAPGWENIKCYQQLGIIL